MSWLCVICSIVIFGMFYEYSRYAYKTGKFANCLDNVLNNLSSVLVVEHLRTLRFAVIQCLFIHTISIAGYIYLLTKIDNNLVIKYGLYFLITLCALHNFYVRKLNKERDKLIKLEVIKINELSNIKEYSEMPTLREALQCHITKLEGSCKWTPS